MKEIQDFLVPPEKFVTVIARKKKHSQLEKMIEMFGENIAGAIMATFAGKALKFPSTSTLRRAATAIYIREQLTGLDPDTPKFTWEVKKLSILFTMPKTKILKICKTGVYEG